MSIDDKFLFEALLRYNYLPMQRRRKEELPPVFDSSSLTPVAASPLLKMKPRNKGFDVVEYRATKFNNVSRIFSIPHPVGYVQLAECMRMSWQDIAKFQNSSVSMIRPRAHSDGRIIVMDYENFTRRARRTRDLAFGNRYTVHTDIVNCFPSMYTHAIPWAAIGVDEAKKKTSGGWYNELDRFARRTVRDETQGIPVGPATSNIIAELMLSTVDSKLSGEFKFERGGADETGMSRFIDDYTYYCDSFDLGQKFLLKLEEELSVYKLRLNPRKTSIRQSITPFSDEWAIELSLRIPTGGSVNAYQAINFLEFASALAERTPEGSVYKYAANALVSSNLDEGAKLAALDYLLVVAMQHPVILPSLNELIKSTSFASGIFPHQARLIILLKENVKLRRSDGMAWCLYYIARHDVSIPDEIARSVLATKDCISILLLYMTGQHESLILDWVNKLEKTNCYELDRYWLLLYQLYVDGKVAADMSSIPESFEAMKDGSVTFVSHTTNDHGGSFSFNDWLA